MAPQPRGRNVAASAIAILRETQFLAEPVKMPSDKPAAIARQSLKQRRLECAGDRLFALARH
jgi:hypothetical protein